MSNDANFGTLVHMVNEKHMHPVLLFVSAFTWTLSRFMAIDQVLWAMIHYIEYLEFLFLALDQTSLRLPVVWAARDR